MPNLLLNGFDAALFLGFYYLNGNLKDKPLALEWLQKACDANNNHSIAAHRHLAKCLMDLEVGKQDYKAAYIHNELFKFLWEQVMSVVQTFNDETSVMYRM